MQIYGILGFQQFVAKADEPYVCTTEQHILRKSDFEQKRLTF